MRRFCSRAGYDYNDVFSVNGIQDKEKDAANEGSVKKFLIDSLDKKLLEKYKTKLEKRFNKPIDKIEIKEIEQAEKSWSAEK